MAVGQPGRGGPAVAVRPRRRRRHDAGVRQDARHNRLGATRPKAQVRCTIDADARDELLGAHSKTLREAGDGAEARIADRALEARHLGRMRSRLCAESCSCVSFAAARSRRRFEANRSSGPGSRRPSSGRWANEYRANSSSSGAARAGRRLPPRRARPPDRRAADRADRARAPVRVRRSHARRARPPARAHLRRRHGSHGEAGGRGLPDARAPSRRRAHARADAVACRGRAAAGAHGAGEGAGGRGTRGPPRRGRRAAGATCWTGSRPTARSPRPPRRVRSAPTRPTGTRARSSCSRPLRRTAARACRTNSISASTASGSNCVPACRSSSASAASCMSAARYGRVFVMAP